MQRGLRFLSIFLALCMTLPMLVGFTSREIVSGAQQQEQKETFTPETPEPLDIPGVVGLEGPSESEYVGRLRNQETNLNTLVFQNSDGTNTMKIYSHPVKYVDEFGKIQDISLDVRERADGGFESASHSVVTTFEKKLADGISLRHKDVDVKIVPEHRGNALVNATVSEDKKQVSYAADAKTSYVYELTYLGFKEDIVVSEYTGQTEYHFTLYTNGLTLVNEYGSYYLTDADGNVRATIGDIIVFTADERNNTFGSMTHETVRANQEYTMTIHLDADYLKDEKTLYPIRIDPTLEIISAGAVGVIEDVIINDTATFSSSFTNLYVGRHPSGTMSRVLMRFPTISLENIAAEDIVSAQISLRDLMCQSDQDFVVECYVYDTAAPAWSESSPPTWSGVGSNYIGSALLDSYTVSYGNGDGGSQWYRFDIRQAVYAWINGTQDPAKGLVFKAADSHENQSTNLWYKTFGSYNRSSYKPALKIVYDASISLPSSISVTEGATQSISATTNATSVVWTSSNTSVATVDANGVVTGINAGTTTVTATITGTDNTTSSASCTVYVHIPDGIYYIRNNYSNMVLFVQNLSMADMTNVVNTVLTSSSAETHQIRQMWKVKYLGAGRYSIRPLHKLDMGLHATDGNANIIDIGANDQAYVIVDTAEWTIEKATLGYLIKQNGSDSGVLQLENESTAVGGNVIVSNTTTSSISEWEFIPVISVPSGALLYDTNTKNTVTNPTRYMKVGDTKSLLNMNLEISTYPSFGQTFSWSSSNEDYATVHTSAGTVTAVHCGGAIITGTLSGGNTVTFTVDVRKTFERLLIYRTRNRETHGFIDASDDNDIIPIIAEDLLYGQKSTNTMLTNGSLVSMSDLYSNDNQIPVSQRVTIVKNFFNSQISYDPTFMEILSDMVDHLMDGSGTNYSNADLTDAVKNHPNTQNYINEVITVIKEQIVTSNGNIESFYYDEQLWTDPVQRKNHIIVNAMRNENIYLPSYGYGNGVPGLSLAINGWYGNKIEIDSLEISEGSYSGTLKFQFYDHFGLDTPDLSVEKYGDLKTGLFPGFRQWYILQHWDELDLSTQPKPFVTIVSYTVEFSGEL